MGSTTLNLHIHNGWETCAWCDPSRARGMFHDLQEAGPAKGSETLEELGVQRRKELNRLKKKYGLRVCVNLEFNFYFWNVILLNINTRIKCLKK